MMTPASASASHGLQRAFADVARAAEAFVSRFGGIEPGPAVGKGLRADQAIRAIVDLNRARTAAKANAKVLQTADDMTGSLLDILA